MGKGVSSRTRAQGISECFDRILDDWAQRDKSTSRCHGCPLSKDSNGPTFGVGNRRDPIVMALGESPNEIPRQKDGKAKGVRDATNHFWKNASEPGNPDWKKMANAFDEIFWDFKGRKTSVYFTNIWKCTNRDIRKSGKMSTNVLGKCGRHFFAEFQAVSPKLIVVFGKRAFEGLSWLLGNEFAVSSNPLKKRLAENRGYPRIEGDKIDIDELAVRVLPAFHWSRGEGNSMQQYGDKNYRDRIRREIAAILKM